MGINGIIFFGDSVLAGTGASARELGCAKLIKESLNIPVSLKARNWNTSQDGLERLDQDVLKQPHLSHVVVLFGNNDCWLAGPNEPKVSLSKFIENIDFMTEQMKKNSQTPILCTLQPIDIQRFTKQFPELLEFQKAMNQDISQLQKHYSNEIKKKCTQQQILFIDLRSDLESFAQEIIAMDGIHPNDKGHKAIASIMLNYFKKMDPSLKILDKCPTQ